MCERSWAWLIGVPASSLLSLKEKAERAQTLLLMAYSLALPIPISTPWTVLIVGLFVWLVLSILDWKIDNARKVVTVKSLWQAPLAPPFVAFAIATTLSGLVNGGPAEALASFWT